MNYQVVPKRTWLWYVRWCLVAVTALVVIYELGALSAEREKQAWIVRHSELQKRYAQILENLATQQKKTAQLEAEAQMARASLKTSQNEIEKLQQEKQNLEKELSFYRSIMAPEDNRKGLTIDSIVIRQADAPGLWQYELVLTQARKQDWYLKGNVNFKITGTHNGKTVQLADNAIFAEHNGAPKFSFRFFQRLTGTIQLPSDFTPQKIYVTAITRDGKQKATAEYSWSNVEVPKNVQRITKQKEKS